MEYIVSEKKVAGLVDPFLPSFIIPNIIVNIVMAMAWESLYYNYKSYTYYTLKALINFF